VSLCFKLTDEEYQSPFIKVRFGGCELPFKPGRAVEADMHAFSVAPLPGDNVYRGAGLYAYSNRERAIRNLHRARRALPSRLVVCEYDDRDVIAHDPDGIGSDTVAVTRLTVVSEITPAGELFEQLLPTAEARSTNRTTSIHGPDHWRRVAENGGSLAASTPAADTLVVQAFAALHDSQRLTDGRDSEHGARAATLARDLHTADALPLDDAQLELLCAALIDHDRGQTSDEPTVGSCWDADRLDLTRLGITVRADRMSTAAGQRQADQLSMRRSKPRSHRGEPRPRLHAPVPSPNVPRR
jgi:uncharacterized protein